MICVPPEFPRSKRFDFVRCIGAGGMGFVFEAYDHDHKQHVALKTMRGVSGTSLYRLKREFRALADITHPNLIALHELFPDGQRCFFTMELLNGESFYTYVRHDSRGVTHLADTVDLPSTGPLTDPPDHPAPPVHPVATLTPSQLRRIRGALLQLCDGLEALHEQRKLHCDIKPSNVLIDKHERLVLLDFGLVAELDRVPRLFEDPYGGTLGFMPPEQIARCKLSAASDWFSVGALLYVTLIGHPPAGPMDCQASNAWHLASPRDLAPETPIDLHEICMGLLRQNAEDRFSGQDIRRLLHVTDDDDSEEPTAIALEPRNQPLILRAARDVPFVGRRRQLQVLEDSLTEVTGGGTAVARLHGPSGLGKSALLERFRTIVRDRTGALLLGGRCYERDNMPFKAIDSVIDALSMHLAARPWSRKASSLPDDFEVLTRVFPVLGRSLQFSVPPAAEVIPDKQEVRRRAFAALRRLLQTLGKRRPVVISIDDLQWGDVDSAELLADLLAPPDPPRLLLLACYRSEDAVASPFLQELDALRRRPGGSVQWCDVELDLLSPEEAYELAEGMFVEPDARCRELARWAAEESGGNPYFVAELIRDSARQGYAPRVTTRHRSLDEALAARIAELPTTALELLEIIAITGQRVPCDVAQQAAAVPTDDLLKAMMLLRTGRLVRTSVLRYDDTDLPESAPVPRDDEFVETYHDRIREVVVNMLDDERRVQLHLALATAWKASPHADPVTLAVHLAAANQNQPAGEMYVQAADRAATSLAFDRAASLYRHALDLLPARDGRTQGLQVKLADALANAGRGADAAEQYGRAAENAEPHEQLELKRRGAIQALISGHIDNGLQELRSVLEAVGMELAPTPARALTNVLWRRAKLRLTGIRHRRCAESDVPPSQLQRIDVCWSAAVGLSIVDTVRGADFQARNLELALKAGEPYRVARALAWEAAHLSTSGRKTQRRAAWLRDKAARLAEQIDNPHARGLVLLSNGIGAFMTGDWRTSYLCSMQAADVFRTRCTGVAWEIDTANTFALWSLTYLGEIRLLCQQLPQIIKEAQQRGNLYAATNFGTFAGHLSWLADDDPEGARDDLREMMRRWSKQGVHVQHLTGLLAQTNADLYSGDGEAAWRHVRETWNALSEAYFLRMQTVRIYLVHMRGRTALAAAAGHQDPGRFLRDVHQSTRQLDREHVPWATALAHLLRAGTANIHHDHRGADHHLVLAGEQLVACDMHLFAAAARYKLGCLRGGDEGRQLAQESEAWMRNEAVRNPVRMAGMYVPGLPDA